MQQTEPDDNIFLRQNDDHLRMCIIVETNIDYYTIKHYLNSFVQFNLAIQVSSYVHIPFQILHLVLDKVADINRYDRKGEEA